MKKNHQLRLRVNRETLRMLGREDHAKVAAATQPADPGTGGGCSTEPTVTLTWSVLTGMPQQCCGNSVNGISCTD